MGQEGQSTGTHWQTEQTHDSVSSLSDHNSTSGGSTGFIGESLVTSPATMVSSSTRDHGGNRSNDYTRPVDPMAATSVS